MPSMPTLEKEYIFWEQGYKYLAGVDEAGRGALSGPVVAAAVEPPPYCEQLPGVKDSKLLTPRRREALYRQIRRQAVQYAIGMASVEEIDKLNILNASWLAMRRALQGLDRCNYALIDGRPGPPDLGPHLGVIKGDLYCYSIACASIIAKVVRDRLMRRLAGRYPGYGWEKNAGYGVRAHLHALQTLGATPMHRRSFAPVRRILDKRQTKPDLWM